MTCPVCFMTGNGPLPPTPDAPDSVSFCSVSCNVCRSNELLLCESNQLQSNMKRSVLILLFHLLLFLLMVAISHLAMAQSPTQTIKGAWRRLPAGAIAAIICFLIVVGEGMAVYAQPIPVNSLDISAVYVPSTSYIKSENNPANHPKTTFQRFNIGYSFMLATHVDTLTNKIRTWTGTVNSNYTYLGNQGLDDPLIPSDLLFSEFSVMHYRSRRNRWSTIYTLSAGLNTDLQKITTNDLFINGGFILLKTYNPRFSLGFGAFVYNAISTPILMPGLFVQWQTAGKFRVNVSLPTEISVGYDANAKTALKLAFRPKNINYDVENKINPDKRALSYWELPIGLESKWKSERFDITFAGGIMALRSFQFYERGIRNMFRSEPGHMMSGNLFVNAGIRYRLSD